MNTPTRATLLLLATYSLAGCASAPPPAVKAEPAPPAPSEPASAPVTEEPAEADVQEHDEDEDEDEPGMGMPEWSTGDEVSNWFEAAGIKDRSSQELIKLTGLGESTQVECDRVLPVGKPVGTAMLCRRQYMEGAWELATSFLLLVPQDGGGLRVLWDARGAAGTLSRTDTSETPFVQLNVSMRDDGEELLLEEEPELDCAGLRKRVAAARKDADPEESGSLANVERMAGQVCRARGRYAWRGGKFVRVGPVPPRARR